MPPKVGTIVAAVAAASILVAAVLAFGRAGPGSSNTPALASAYPCSHVGGGMWEEVWNNSSGGGGPTSVWVPEPGHYWAEYNNSTFAAANPGWASSGAGTASGAPGWTVVNMTNQSSVAESMMEYICSTGAPSLPWHFDPAAQTFVRDS